MEKLVIRADASTQMGTGHVMRCFALAQAFQAEGGAVLFVVAALPPILQTRLESEGIAVERLSDFPGGDADAIATVALAQRWGASWVVVDGYQFGGAYQRSLKDQGVWVLAFDDYGHAEFYAADLVLNQNISAREAWYERRSPHTKLLLGTHYALLRQEFCRWQSWSRSPHQSGRQVLVTLGGSDPDNVTTQVLAALVAIDTPLEVDVVVGVSNPHGDVLQQWAADLPHAITLHRNSQTIGELMAIADLAISAGGSTCWELAFMQVPMLLVILAQNQEEMVRTLAQHENAINLGWYHTLTPQTLSTTLQEVLQNSNQRNQLAVAGRVLVDGLGCQAVLAAMQQLSIS